MPETMVHISPLMYHIPQCYLRGSSLTYLSQWLILEEITFSISLLIILYYQLYIILEHILIISGT